MIKFEAEDKSLSAQVTSQAVGIRAFIMLEVEFKLLKLEVVVIN
jgi:hypothetical protein